MNVRSNLFCLLNAATCLAAVCIFGKLAPAVAEPPPLPPIVELTVQAAGKEIAVAVEVKDAKPTPVSFVREIQPSMSKVGCNAGTCHGAQEGKNGFKLTLRGYDPELDYFALVDDLSGRRFNRSLPSQSLMLLKPTQGVPHVGGFLFDEDSRYYRMI